MKNQKEIIRAGISLNGFQYEVDYWADVFGQKTRQEISFIKGQGRFEGSPLSVAQIVVINRMLGAGQ